MTASLRSIFPGGTSVYPPRSSVWEAVFTSHFTSRRGDTMGQSQATDYDCRSTSSVCVLSVHPTRSSWNAPNPTTHLRSRHLSVHVSLQLTKATPALPRCSDIPKISTHTGVCVCVCVPRTLGLSGRGPEQALYKSLKGWMQEEMSRNF